MNKSASLILAVLLVAVALAGCATSSGTTMPAHPAMLRRPASMDAVIVATTSALTNLDRESRVFNDHVVSTLRQTDLFPDVNEAGDTNRPDSGIQVAIRITQLKPVSNDARVWFGGLAGQAMVAATVNICELDSGQLIETFAVEGKSGKSARAGTTDEALQCAAEQVASAVVRLNSQSAP
jgi:hypothetical protein